MNSVVFPVVIIVVLISVLIIMIRAINGPTAYDRILAANSFGTKTVVMIALLSESANDTMYIDVALVYALINYIATIGIMKYFKYRSLGKEG